MTDLDLRAWLPALFGHPAAGDHAVVLVAAARAMNDMRAVLAVIDLRHEMAVALVAVEIGPRWSVMLQRWVSV
jgi:hypothetical protein